MSEQEKAVMGYILNPANSSQQILEKIIEVKQFVSHPLMYANRNYQVLSLCLDEMAAQDLAIDVYTLDSHLQKLSFSVACEKLRALRGAGEYYLTNINDEQIEDSSQSVSSHIGGVATILDIAQTYLAKSTLKKTCEHIATDYQRRRALNLIGQYQGKLNRVDNHTQDMVEELIRRLGHISDPRLETHNIASVLADKKATGFIEDDQYLDAYWPIAQLNEMVPLRRGSFTILAGGPGSGKTSLGAMVAFKTMMKQGPRSVLYVTLEMDKHEITNLILAQQMHLDVRKVERNMIPESIGYEELAMDINTNKGIEILDKEDTTHEDIAQAAKLLTARGTGVKLIVVDHIHIMTHKDKRLSEYERVSEISRALKRLAKSTGAAVLGLCQYNRSNKAGNHDSAGNAKADKEPTMSDLRGSGSLEQDANAIAMLWNREEDSHKSLCITKNRKGRCGQVDLHFHGGEGQWFNEWDFN